MTSIAGPGVSNSFVYNGLDTRVGVTDSLGTRSFKRNGVGVTASVLSDGLASLTPSGEVRGGVKTTFSSALKNDDIQTSSSQAVSASRVYDALGNQLTTSGSWKSSFGYAGGFGYQSDLDSGLKLLGHRYYDSSTGRFLTRDPAKDGRNWYGYCGNDPVNFLDAVGLRRTWVYRLYDEFGNYLKTGITRDLNRRLREHKKRFGKGTKYGDKIVHFDDEIPEGTRYGKQNPEALMHEREQIEKDPGPYNRERYLNRGLAGGGLSQATKGMLDDYNEEIDKHKIDDWGVWAHIPIVGDVIDGALLLGEWINGVGRESRRERAQAFENALSE